MIEFADELTINQSKIGSNQPTYFIADIAANHDGDLQRAIDLIYMAKEAGADAAKFQHFNASTIVSDVGFKSLGTAKSHQALWEKSVYEVYDDASLNLGWTSSLHQACVDAGIAFLTSPYSKELVDHVESYVPAYKIGSGDITWIDLIKYIAEKNKPVILASGASNLDDVLRAVEATAKVNNKIVLMQCNTNYTGSVENFKYINLNVLKTYSELFPGMILGLSDHTPGIATVLGAVSLGARVIEKHFTDDISRKGPDHAFSMDPISWNQMVCRTRELEMSFGSKIKKIEDNELETAILQRRSIRINKDLKKNHVIERDDLVFLRPSPNNALPPYQAEFVVGRRLKSDMVSGDHIELIDLL